MKMSEKNLAPAITDSQRPSLLKMAMQINKMGLLQFFMQQWREQGDIAQLRMGRQELSLIVHPEHARRVLLTERQHYDKLDTWETTRQLLLGDGLIAANGAQWKRQRRLMSGFFTAKSIEHFYPLMVDAAEAVSKRWEAVARSGEMVDVLAEMTQITAWIILRSMFGTEIDEQRLHDLAGDVETLIKFGNRREMLPVKAPLWAPLPSHVQHRKATTRVHSFIREVISRRRNEPESSWPEDLLSKLMSARDEETGDSMADILIRDECLGIFVAGHETTARTLAFLWYMLDQNPQVAERLQSELDGVFSRDQVPTLEDLRRLPYLIQVIKEVLRLYPPAPAFPRDAITPQNMDGALLSPGTYLLVFPYATHRHPDFWEDPESFDPDRFLPERETQIHPFAYYPFGGGNRVCIGNNFAMQEMSILTALLARKFSARMKPGHVPKIDMQGTLMMSNSLPMSLSART